MLKKVLEKFSLEAENVDKKDIIVIGMERRNHRKDLILVYSLSFI
jgi:hypothetical protein